MSPTRSLTVFHTSDFQVGRPYLPEVADAMIRLAEEVDPDVVVASGDLTQRAKRREFQEARRLLDRFGDVPLVVTPGNHDVPLYRTLERLATPYRNWRRFADRHELDTVTRVEGATFVALSSAAPRRAVVAGRLRSSQLAYAHEAFTRSPVRDHRIVVTHHHFVPVPGGGAGQPLSGAVDLLREIEGMGVSAVLGGHVHQLHLHTSTDLTGSPKGVPLISTGTATSRRGRGREVGANSVCVLRFGDDTLEVTPWLRGPRASDFEALDPRTFELGGRAAVTPGQVADDEDDRSEQSDDPGDRPEQSDDPGDRRAQADEAEALS